MDKTIAVGLNGHDERYRLDEEAYDRLAGYLDRAGARLGDDPDRDEVLGDLERSIGDRLAAAGSSDRLVTAAEIDAVLEAVGAVDPGRDSGTGQGPSTGRTSTGPTQEGRRLHRIREGQKIAGVCTGLAAYSELDVTLVRVLFVLGAIFTGGVLLLLYFAMAFILPVSATREA
jgi:phage shock protein C